jgi:hypothetical protein
MAGLVPSTSNAVDFSYSAYMFPQRLLRIFAAESAPESQKAEG